MNQVKIKDIVADKKYAVVDGPFGTQLHASEYVEEGVPVIRVKNIGWGPFINKDLKFITEEKASEIDRSSVFPGDIIIAKTGATTGKTCVFPDIFEKAIIASSCAKISLDHTKAISDYVYRFLLSPHGYAQIIGQSAGSTRTTIGLKGINDLKIPLPPLDQQKKIAAILDAADAYRQKTKALIEKYDELTQSLFLDMFGDPKNNTKDFQRGLIGDFINIQGGSQPPKSLFKTEFIEGYVRLVQIRDYKSDKYLTYVPENSTKKFCTQTDIMIGRYGPPVFQILRGISGAYNVALMKATPLKGLHSEYVFHLLSCRYIQEIIIVNSQRTAGQTGVNLKLLNSIEISIPPIELQNRFAERVQTIEAQKAQAQASLAQSEDLFNSLLQRAFKGELIS